MAPNFYLRRGAEAGGVVGVGDVAMDGPSKERAGLIGPILPYRGGIAQYTTMLHRALGACSELLTVSLKRDYPRWMYPGRSCREPGYEDYREPGVVYALDPLSPLTWLPATRLLKEHRPTRVVITWWAVFWAPCLVCMARQLERRGVTVIFLCHNVLEHEAAPWKNFLTRAALSHRRAFIVHSEADAGKLKALAPTAPIHVHDHPIYSHFPPLASVLPRRAKLELLFFGFVRAYKGVDVLVAAMERLKDADIFLTIAGEWWMADGALRARADALARVEVVDRYVPEDEAGQYFVRSDVVVLPYRSASGTGIIPLAYNYGKPVIASRIGGLIDAVEEGASGVLVEPTDPEALAIAISAFLDGHISVTREGIDRAAAPKTWESLARTILTMPA